MSRMLALMKPIIVGFSFVFGWPRLKIIYQITTSNLIIWLTTKKKKGHVCNKKWCFVENTHKKETRHKNAVHQT